MSKCAECNDTGFILEDQKDRNGLVRKKAKFCWCKKERDLKEAKEKRDREIKDEVLF